MEKLSDDEMSSGDICPKTVLPGESKGAVAVPFNDTSLPFPDPGPPPDGGTRAWVQALMSHLMGFISWGYLASFGVFQSYYTTTLGRPPSDITWIGSIEIFLIFFIGTFAGRALDAGYFRPIFICGVTLSILGTFMSSISTTYWQLFLSQGICIGVGDALMFTPTIGLVSTYFSRRRSMVLAFTACGAATGSMVFPAMTRSLLPKLGFGWTVRVMGFMQMGIAALLIACLKPRLPPRPSGPLVEWSAFREAPYTLYIIGMFFNWMPMYFAFFYAREPPRHASRTSADISKISSFGRDIIGLSYAESINVLIMLNGLGALGRFLPAVLADLKLGPLNAMLIPNVLSAILMYTWPSVHTVPGLWAFAAFDGLIPNGVQGLWPATLASLTDDITKTGTRLGMGFTVVSFACATGPPLGGALIQLDNGGYRYASIWAGTSFLVGSVFMIAARICKSGWKLKYRV